MEPLRTVFSRSLSLFRRRRLDSDLDEEVRSHIDFAIEENLQAGMSREEARTSALRSFGGLTQIKEDYRMQRGLPLIEQIGRDVRFAIRQLRRSPGFALTAVLTLALGLGANTAVFSLINGLMLRPLPVPHPDELAVIRIDRNDDGDSVYGHNYSFPATMFRALEKRHDAFQSVAGFAGQGTFQVRGSSGNVEIPGAMVGGEFFSVMETAPLLGRLLGPQDDQPGGTSTGFGVVITEDLWRRWFNGTPDVLGRRMTIANAPFTVVGVLPKSFVGADPTFRPEIYAPLWAEPVIDAPYNNTAGGYHSWWMRIIARRKAGVSLEQANAALLAASNSIVNEVIEDADSLADARKNHLHLAAESGSTGYSYLRKVFRKPLGIVFVLCAAMLLLACLNLASLLMARSAARERELATRLAMGATRRRLVQQLLVESLLIALLGTAAGMVAAPLVSRFLASVVVARTHSATLDTSIDFRVFAFIALASLVSAVLIGLIPALRSTSSSLNEQIKSGSHVSSARERRRWLPRVLMSLEVALALLLVVGAGLLATSLLRLYRTGLGFEPNGVAVLRLDMGKQSLDGPVLMRWYEEFGDALRHEPGVRSISFASDTPLNGSIWTEAYKSPLSKGDQEVYMTSISPDYFQTMRITLSQGRDFTWKDTLAGGHKIVLSQQAAKLLFPGQNPVGQHVVDFSKVAYEVIGVVGDVHIASVRKNAPESGYVPMTQDDSKKPSYTAVVRLDGSAVPLADAARRLAARTAPDIPAPVLTTISGDLDATISSERMMAMLSVFFAVCALVVTAIGLYGTLAYTTARRTSEIGIRMALGAQRGQVVAMVFRENAWISVCGSVCGLAVALLASRALASFLYGTSVRDPWVMVGSVAALTAIASAASLVPALRAARINPIQALRAE
jgi:predicted permease